MKAALKISAITLILLFTGSTLAAAGSRYYGYRHYRPHHYSHHYRSHSHSSSDFFWGVLGATILTTVLVHALTNNQHRHDRIVYRPPPARYVVVRQPPQTTVYRPTAEIVPQPELILRRVEITAQLLNIRRIPDPASDIIGQQRRGTIIDVIGAAPEWIYVKTATGTYGWVMERYTQPAGGPVG